MRKAQVQDGGARIPGLGYAAGFTLIEVLIAMSLLSIMVVLLFSSLRICAQSWEKGENKITEVNEVAVVYNFFQRHLSSAIPVSNDFMTGDDRDAAGQSGTDTGNAGNDGNTAGQSGAGAGMKDKNNAFSFQGKKKSLQFVSVFPASVGRAGMQLFSIQPQRQGKEQVINVTLTPFFPVAEGKEWHREEAVLLKHVSDFELAYFGAADDDASKNSWQDDWLEKDVQPKLVKITIHTTDGVFWPEMVIELKVADAGTGTGVNAAPLGIGVGN
ncbi:prepilin-type N-terminal cleavage/methylation domain-containing protein [Methylobacter sp.]|uniref:prepilin-type N-terminal cleavage/methylation domain-containing protein n=1 Tax=Methylobacter sp. TaxID=2051955 RepID=UPI002FDC9B4B